MNVIYHHYGITECYNSIKMWKKNKQTPGQSVAQCGSSGFKNKRCPEMCDWIQGQQNANSINAFRNWFLTGPPLNTGGCV